AVSQAIGRGAPREEIGRLSLHAFGLGMLLALVLAGGFAALSGPLFSAMGAGEEVRVEIAAYVPIWAASFPFLVVLMITNALFRAHGNAVSASLFMVLAAVLN
ncbi:MATE family efflux transporter, partial [Cribrihabitans sp. XS_ASV171]